MNEEKAFPVFDFTRPNCQGMDLRDYIAIKAMEGITASGRDLSSAKIADQAYKMADEMMLARTNRWMR